ncbi:MAG: hypothetical protein AAGI48_04100 [Verrucomicrobiota bacterium]
MNENFSVTQRRFNTGPGPLVLRPGKGRRGLGAGTGARIASRGPELAIVTAGLIGWLAMVLKVGLSTGVGAKAFAAAVGAPLLVMFFPLCMLGRLGERGGTVLAWTWCVFVTLVVFAVLVT